MSSYFSLPSFDIRNSLLSFNQSSGSQSGSSSNDHSSSNTGGPSTSTLSRRYSGEDGQGVDENGRPSEFDDDGDNWYDADVQQIQPHPPLKHSPRTPTSSSSALPKPSRISIPSSSYSQNNSLPLQPSSPTPSTPSGFPAPPPIPHSPTSPSGSTGARGRRPPGSSGDSSEPPSPFSQRPRSLSTSSTNKRSAPPPLLRIGSSTSTRSAASVRSSGGGLVGSPGVPTGHSVPVAAAMGVVDGKLTSVVEEAGKRLDVNLGAYKMNGVNGASTSSSLQPPASPNAPLLSPASLAIVGSFPLPSRPGSSASQYSESPEAATASSPPRQPTSRKSSGNPKSEANLEQMLNAMEKEKVGLTERLDRERKERMKNVNVNSLSGGAGSGGGSSSGGSGSVSPIPSPASFVSRSRSPNRMAMALGLAEEDTPSNTPLSYYFNNASNYDRRPSAASSISAFSSNDAHSPAGGGSPITATSTNGMGMGMGIGMGMGMERRPSATSILSNGSSSYRSTSPSAASGSGHDKPPTRPLKSPMRSAYSNLPSPSNSDGFGSPTSAKDSFATADTPIKANGMANGGGATTTTTTTTAKKAATNNHPYPSAVANGDSIETTSHASSTSTINSPSNAKAWAKSNAEETVPPLPDPSQSLMSFVPAAANMSSSFTSGKVPAPSSTSFVTGTIAAPSFQSSIINQLSNNGPAATTTKIPESHHDKAVEIAGTTTAAPAVQTPLEKSKSRTAQLRELARSHRQQPHSGSNGSNGGGGRRSTQISAWRASVGSVESFASADSGETVWEDALDENDEWEDVEDHQGDQVVLVGPTKSVTGDGDRTMTAVDFAYVNTSSPPSRTDFFPSSPASPDTRAARRLTRETSSSSSVSNMMGNRSSLVANSLSSNSLFESESRPTPHSSPPSSDVATEEESPMSASKGTFEGPLSASRLAYSATSFAQNSSSARVAGFGGRPFSAEVSQTPYQRLSVSASEGRLSPRLRSPRRPFSSDYGQIPVSRLAKLSYRKPDSPSQAPSPAAVPITLPPLSPPLSPRVRSVRMSTSPTLSPDPAEGPTFEFRPKPLFLMPTSPPRSRSMPIAPTLNHRPDLRLSTSLTSTPETEEPSGMLVVSPPGPLSAPAATPAPAPADQSPPSGLTVPSAANGSPGKVPVDPSNRASGSSLGSSLFDFNTPITTALMEDEIEFGDSYRREGSIFERQRAAPPTVVAVHSDYDATSAKTIGDLPSPDALSPTGFSNGADTASIYTDDEEAISFVDADERSLYAREQVPDVFVTADDEHVPALPNLSDFLVGGIPPPPSQPPRDLEPTNSRPSIPGEHVQVEHGDTFHTVEMSEERQSVMTSGSIGLPPQALRGKPPRVDSLIYPTGARPNGHPLHPVPELVIDDEDDSHLADIPETLPLNITPRSREPPATTPPAPKESVPADSEAEGAGIAQMVDRSSVPRSVRLSRADQWRKDLMRMLDNNDVLAEADEFERRPSVGSEYLEEPPELTASSVAKKSRRDGRPTTAQSDMSMHSEASAKVHHVLGVAEVASTPFHLPSSAIDEARRSFDPSSPIQKSFFFNQPPSFQPGRSNLSPDMQIRRANSSEPLRDLANDSGYRRKSQSSGDLRQDAVVAMLSQRANAGAVGANVGANGGAEILNIPREPRRDSHQSSSGSYERPLSPSTTFLLRSCLGNSAGHRTVIDEEDLFYASLAAAAAPTPEKAKGKRKSFFKDMQEKMRRPVSPSQRKSRFSSLGVGKSSRTHGSRTSTASPSGSFSSSSSIGRPISPAAQVTFAEPLEVPRRKPAKISEPFLRALASHDSSSPGSSERSVRHERTGIIKSGKSPQNPMPLGFSTPEQVEAATVPPFPTHPFSGPIVPPKMVSAPRQTPPVLIPQRRSSAAPPVRTSSHESFARQNYGMRPPPPPMKDGSFTAAPNLPTINERGRFPDGVSMANRDREYYMVDQQQGGPAPTWESGSQEDQAIDEARARKHFSKMAKRRPVPILSLSASEQQKYAQAIANFGREEEQGMAEGFHQ